MLPDDDNCPCDLTVPQILLIALAAVVVIAIMF